ncbi:MAG: tRNA uridine-5-carboxymethylaminomethyl(34) synthesis GTPase MnmE [Rhizomicrobium sp.]
MMADRNTIYALASAPGRGGVAVVRVSGKKALHCLNTLTKKENIAPRAAHLYTLYNGDGASIDTALCLSFPAPASYTGEDVVEFHIHGGKAVLAALYQAISAIDGLRMAEPGEFTRRAVENGKLDLTQAEAIADLVDAQTEMQRRQAVRQYGGALTQLYESWRSELMQILALTEAAIDFADEEIPDDTVNVAGLKVDALKTAIEQHLNDGRRGEILREGLKLAIIGPPNAGKSSLVNALTAREVAIVSDEAGTTRDVIEVRLDLGGYPVILADTAGLRNAAGKIEAEGVRRAIGAAKTADLVVLLRDGTLPDDGMDLGTITAPVLKVWNKADQPWPVPRDGLAISVRTGHGIDLLLDAITRAAKDRTEADGDAPLTRPRHREALRAALASLVRAGVATEPELFAEDVRLALRAIGRITGSVDVENILDIVFREFCLGK